MTTYLGLSIRMCLPSLIAFYSLQLAGRLFSASHLSSSHIILDGKYQCDATLCYLIAISSPSLATSYSRGPHKYCRIPWLASSMWPFAFSLASPAQPSSRHLLLSSYLLYTTTPLLFCYRSYISLKDKAQRCWTWRAIVYIQRMGHSRDQLS